MRYCDKCGAAITSGGHKSAAQGLFSTPYLCGDCYAAETDATIKTVGCFARLGIGVLSGLGMTAGVCALLSKVPILNSAQISTATATISVEAIAIACFITGMIGSRTLKSKFFRFICKVVAYFSFWMSIVFGVAMYFILKYDA